MAEDAAGRQVYLYRYPETDSARGVIQLNGSLNKPKAEGLAVFLSPNGNSYQAGIFRQNKPSGQWISVQINQKNNCPLLKLETKPDQVDSILHKCYPDSLARSLIQLEKANYIDGELNGPATRSQLDGTVTQSLYYQAGKPFGKEIINSYWAIPSFTVLHTDAGSDTLVLDTGRGNATIATSLELVEQMPAFSSPNCPPLDLHFSTVLQRETYQQCTTTAMLEFIYNNIKYPTSSRRLGVVGTNITTFLIEKDGSLADVRTIQFVSGPIDAESIRVIESMPPWIPGVQKGERVRVQFNLPIKYNLE